MTPGEFGVAHRHAVDSIVIPRGLDLAGSSPIEADLQRPPRQDPNIRVLDLPAR